MDGVAEGFSLQPFSLDAEVLPISPLKPWNQETQQMPVKLLTLSPRIGLLRRTPFAVYRTWSVYLVGTVKPNVAMQAGRPRKVCLLC